jgi:hypothetical protein
MSTTRGVAAYAAVHESVVGTNRTSSDVRSSVANGGKADMAVASDPSGY